MGQYHFQRRSERQAAHFTAPAQFSLAGLSPSLNSTETDDKMFNETRVLLEALMCVTNIM